MRISIQKAYGLSAYKLSNLVGQMEFIRTDARGRIYPHGTKKAVLRAIVDRYPSVWASVEDIAKHASVGVRQTQRILRELENEDRLILRINNPRGGAPGDTTQFYIDDRKILDIVTLKKLFNTGVMRPTPTESTGDLRERTGDLRDGTGDLGETTGDLADRRRVTQPTPEPIKEPIKEPVREPASEPVSEPTNRPTPKRRRGWVDGAQRLFAHIFGQPGVMRDSLVDRRLLTGGEACFSQLCQRVGARHALRVLEHWLLNRPEEFKGLNQVPLLALFVSEFDEFEPDCIADRAEQVRYLRDLRKSQKQQQAA